MQPPKTSAAAAAAAALLLPGPQLVLLSVASASAAVLISAAQCENLALGGGQLLGGCLGRLQARFLRSKSHVSLSAPPSLAAPPKKTTESAPQGPRNAAWPCLGRGVPSVGSGEMSSLIQVSLEYWG